MERGDIQSHISPAKAGKIQHGTPLSVTAGILGTDDTPALVYLRLFDGITGLLNGWTHCIHATS
jgi:hypothetical protein